MNHFWEWIKISLQLKKRLVSVGTKFSKKRLFMKSTAKKIIFQILLGSFSEILHRHFLKGCTTASSFYALPNDVSHLPRKLSTIPRKSDVFYSFPPAPLNVFSKTFLTKAFTNIYELIRNIAMKCAERENIISTLQFENEFISAWKHTHVSIHAICVL